MNSTPRLLLTAVVILLAGFLAGLQFAGPTGRNPFTSPTPLPSNEAPVDPSSPPAPTDLDGHLEVVINPDGRLAAEGNILRERAGTISLAVLGAHLEPVKLMIGTLNSAGALLTQYTFTLEAGVVGESDITLTSGNYEIWTVPVAPGPESRLTLTITE